MRLPTLLSPQKSHVTVTEDSSLSPSLLEHRGQNLVCLLVMLRDVEGLTIWPPQQYDTLLHTVGSVLRSIRQPPCPPSVGQTPLIESCLVLVPLV
jgi:hypothetical protein